MTASEEERGQFVTLLINALTEPHGPVVILLTLRADFSDRPMHYPQLGHLIEEHHKPVFAMSIGDLRTIIEQPAALPDVQLTFQGDLVSDLLFEVQGMVGALPLLQFTLDQLFQRRSGHQLTLQSYREIGGIKGALAKQAETTYAALPSEEHRGLARVMFLRLIDPGITGHDTTRRRAALSEFLLVSATQTRLTAETIEAFTTSRLLTSNTIAGIPSLEVSHEALIREWVRLFDWLREAREDIRFQQSLSEDVAEWEQRDKPGDRLYRGTQLKEAQAWVGHNMPSRNEAVFLRASARRSKRTRANVLAILLLLVVTVGVAVKLLLLVLSAPNPTYVTNLSDQGVGSLRWAIDAASPGSTITFAPTLKGTIELATNNLDISKELSIRGPGTGSIASVYEGGGINQNGLLEITNSTISSNRSDGNGGGIDNNGFFDIANSTISANKALNEGGGIESPGGLTLTSSTVSDNSALTYGGGIAVSFPSYTIDFCTIYGNTATQDGGIANYQHRAKDPFQDDHGNGIGESILVGNHAHTSSNISGVIRSHGYNLIQYSSSSTSFVLLNLKSPDVKVSSSSFLGIDAFLRKNGGQTLTHALIPGSPAIDRIPPGTCQLIGITPDQRGVKGPQGHGCDIGAYEYQSSP